MYIYKKRKVTHVVGGARALEKPRVSSYSSQIPLFTITFSVCLILR